MSTNTKTVITGTDVKCTLNGDFPDECEIVQFEVNGLMYEGFYYENEDDNDEPGWFAKDNVMGYEEKINIPEGTPVYWLMLPTLQSLYEEEHS